MQNYHSGKRNFPRYFPRQFAVSCGEGALLPPINLSDRQDNELKISNIPLKRVD